ncbi:LOW QUALITY PROTEIN: nose resistant to fluoxetine protein 6 [Drosophila eugracilis]|uniref:LOW QUALITY PROTEIN: nose resistant to fluoxetine protein 6 n=1 Tax=Drosophila eugracilis TaxID=29029 RepID=UPI001BDA900A|nr:LOW QUALITY PROTEIN: nose resistant to fluoxetine protein 6 [Drosophila eugracilis]
MVFRQSSCSGSTLLILVLILGLGLPNAHGYSSKDLLTWMQASNFGYQVLKQALNDNQSSTASEASCLAEVRLLLKGAEEKSLPALRVFDAWGKFPQGLLYGHFVDMGNYESCLSLDLSRSLGSTVTINAGSKYCLSNIQFESLLLESVGSAALTLRIGTCMPSSCSADQLNRWLQGHLEDMFGENSTGVTLVQENDCSLAHRDPMDGLDWFAVSVLIVLCVLVLLATIFEYGGVSNKILGSFSLLTNLPQLLKTSNTPSPRVIPCLNGIRCLTIIWIILGHGYMYLLLSPTINAYEIVAWAKTPFSMVLQSGSTSVDTFFLLSGLLLVLTTLRELDRTKGRLHVPLMYLHRLVRLTPVLALAVLIFMTLFNRLDSGPLWQQFTGSSDLCSDTWWATLLYVQNYAAPGRMCLGHSWYLAVDMQLYIISPLLLIALYKWGKKAVGGIVLLILLLFGCVFSIIIFNDLHVFVKKGNLGGDSPQMRLIYYTTHARATPWLIGLLFGYFLHHQNGRKSRLPKWLALILWILSISLLGTVIYAVYPYTQDGVDEISPLAGAFYLCLSRIAWPLGLCWIIWACQNGLAPVVNDLLSWSFWQPISKLSYCLYIWHLLVETVHIARIKTSLHFSDYDAILRFWSDFGITMLVSLFMHLFVEVPFSRLEMELLKKRRNAEANKQIPSIETSTEPVEVNQATSISRQNLVEP